MRATFGLCSLALGLALGLPAAPRAARAQDIGQVKLARGGVHVERGGQRLPASAGLRLQPGDVIVTGPDGAAGLTFVDESLLSVGPGTVLAIDRLAFDTTTHLGAFDSSLRAGTLAGVSGKIVRQTPGAMRVRTPAAILGVRGTEFAVRTSE